MKVKICGITDIKTGVEAAKYGADAIGFVFAPSKRKVSKEAAREIAAHLPEEVFKIGVFVNESKEEIERISKLVGLTHVQLHGDETPGFSKSLSFPVVKAMSFEGNDQLKDSLSFPCEYLLLDGPKGKYRGGNGSSFNWNELDTLLLKDKKIILAGGLNLDNVSAAISKVKPFMVDVSSGVETDGKKDLAKIKAFVQKAKEN